MGSLVLGFEIHQPGRSRSRREREPGSGHFLSNASVSWQVPLRGGGVQNCRRRMEGGPYSRSRMGGQIALCDL